MTSFFPRWANKGAHGNCPRQFAVKTQRGRWTSAEAEIEASCDSLPSFVKFWTSLGYCTTPPRPTGFLEIAELWEAGEGRPPSVPAHTSPPPRHTQRRHIEDQVGWSRSFPQGPGPRWVSLTHITSMSTGEMGLPATTGGGRGLLGTLSHPPSSPQCTPFLQLVII